MAMFNQADVFVKFGEWQVINVQGDGYGLDSSNGRDINKASLLDKEMMLNLNPLNQFPVLTACSCLRSEASNLSARPRSSSPSRRLADRFMKSTAVNSNQLIEEDDDEDSQTLTSFLATLHRFSSRVLNPLQAKSVIRLAHGFRAKENLTWSLSQQIVEFLECDSPPLQDATLIVLAKFVSRAENGDFLFSQSPKILDLVLSLASDAMTIEVQVSAFKVIEELSHHHDNVPSWEAQLEDIVYPLLKGVLRNRASTQQQKLAALGVVRNLSNVPGLAGKIKQDVLAQLNAIHNDSKVKALFLEVLQGNLELTKQRIATDVLDNTLLPVLTDMLAEGPCEPQHQALTLLACLAPDEGHRISLLNCSKTVAFCILCTKYSKCRKVIALGCHVIEQLLQTKNKKEAKKFMECNLESLVLDGSATGRGVLENKEGKMMSHVRKKSQVEAELWRSFDKLLEALVLIFEKQGCIYHDMISSRLKSELNLIGSINRDQLMCIMSLIGCFNNFCHWPLNRPRKRSGSLGDVEEFLALNILGEDANELNHNHTVFIWSIAGSQVMALFRQIIKRVQTSDTVMAPLADTNAMEQLNSKLPGSLGERNCTFDADQDPKPQISSALISTLHKEELELLKQALKFVFFMSLVTCYLKKLEDCERPISARSVNESVERKAKEDLAEREACAERRGIRRGLVEEGVFHLMGILVNLNDMYIKVMTATVLRLCVQPVTEKALSSALRRKINLETTAARNLRPHSAKDWLGRQSINQRVFNMAKPGLGQRPTSSVPYCTSASSHNAGGRRGPVVVLDEGNTRRRPATARPFITDWNSAQGHTTRPSSATKYSLFSPLTPRAERKTLFSKSTGSAVHQGPARPQSAVSRRPSSRQASASDGPATHSRPASAKLASKYDVTSVQDSHQLLHAPLDPGNNLSQQCCERVVMATREKILKDIFNTDVDIKKSSLLLLHDLVQHSTSDLHMELSKMGCIPKLVDFLRINDDDELLEITGLTITRMLVSSDRRICQLFNIHGGSNLLMALLQNASSVDLKAAVSSTLTTVNNVMHPSHQTNPKLMSSNHPSDIWEHIMQRWEGEDKVVEVLKQFL